MFVIRLVSLQQTLALRSAVLRPGRPLGEAVFPHDDEEETLHLGAFNGEAIVGIASLYREPMPGSTNTNTWRLRGMAVAPALQGRGIGRLLLHACFDQVQARGGTVLWCNARSTAQGFYATAGFQIRGEEFEIPGIGAHFAMVRRIQA
jgi:GNAT superfamily N-acetyltransferase